MSDSERPDRLSQVSTMWTVFARAHAPDGDPDRAALAALLDRYHTAAYRYLLAAARDEDAAADLFQEFAVKFLRGEFGRADAAKGRFRDYLKVCLSNQVRRFRQQQARGPRVVNVEVGELAGSEPDEVLATDEAFLEGWRKTLLDRVWDELRAVEARGGTAYFTALRTRADFPDLSSAELAARLTERLHPAEPYTDTGVRKMLQRGREQFADLLVAEVARSVPTADRERLAQELIDLGFHGHCRNALGRWKADPADGGGQ